MRRRYFVHFEITRNCMQAGIREPGDDMPDVFDNLAMKLRKNPGVRQMVQQIKDGKCDKVIVGVGREYPNETAEASARQEPS